MQLVSLSTLSAFVIASAGLVTAVPAAHNADIVQRASSHHRAIARDAAAAVAKPRAAVAVPRTLMSKNKKKRSTKQKRCRIRPTSSSAVPTATSSSIQAPDVTGTVDGGDDSFHHHLSSAGAAPAPSATGTYDTPWTLAKARQGNTFFDAWTFWNLPDPTHGSVTFVDAGTAWNEQLIGFDANGAALMKADTGDNVGYRKSIRIHDNDYTFNTNTLILMDSTHMPTGCGTWPAFWANGPNWPTGGEIDIVEGVHGQTQNQATLHTSEGCFASSDDHPVTGQLTNGNCGSSNGDNTGCGYTDTTSDNSFGAGFNNANGGVYAMQWVDSGISIWFFPRTAIPDDITAEQPMPWTWPTPFARWSSNSCNPNQYFNNNNAIFDLTFCGDWAGATWESSGCRDQTGAPTCQDYVAGLGRNFDEAYWAVNYVKYFRQ